MLLTGWGNKAMPFIRYQVGDNGIRGSSSCSCGRQSICFDSIEGRLEDYIVCPDGRKIIGMNQVFEYAPGATEIQLYQDSRNSVEFRIVPSAQYSDNDLIALEREFRRRAGDSIMITFKLVNKIERSSGGKFKAVISKVLNK